MNDIHCGQCGEPWELYTVNRDFEEILNPEDIPVDDPASFFKRGNGCPTCSWGEDESKKPIDSLEKSERNLQRAKDIMNNTDEDPFKYI